MGPFDRPFSGRNGFVDFLEGVLAKLLKSTHQNELWHDVRDNMVRQT